MRRLFDLLFPPRVDESVVRTLSDEDFLALLTPRVVSATQPAAVALLPFATPSVRAALHEAKYHGSIRSFRLLALVLTDYLRDCDELGPSRSSVRLVPVPLGRARRKERGFNQIEEIIGIAAKVLHFTVEATLLERTRETVSQVSLPRKEREENMRRAFRATHLADPSLTYVIIDDTLTTGATLQAAIDALKEAGAEHIIPLALAH